MADDKTDWTAKLLEDDRVKFLIKAKGFDASQYTAISEEDYNSKIERARNTLSFNGEELRNEFEEWKKKKEEEEKAKGGTEGKEQTDSEKRGQMDVGGEGQTEETDWIEKKRAFWKQYAEENSFTFTNDPEKDLAEKTFTGALGKTNGDKQEILGEIKYTSPTSATISPESSIELYQGLVADAISNNLSVNFGKSLDDKQKAMLLAACLMNDKTYPNGDKLEIKNPPEIDINAEYFKELPEEVQKVLKEHIEKQQQKEQAEQKTQEQQPENGDTKTPVNEEYAQDKQAYNKKQAEAAGIDTKDMQEVKVQVPQGSKGSDIAISCDDNNMVISHSSGHSVCVSKGEDGKYTYKQVDPAGKVSDMNPEQIKEFVNSLHVASGNLAGNTKAQAHFTALKNVADGKGGR